MKYRKRNFHLALCSAAFALVAVTAIAQPVAFTLHESGYTSGSIVLPENVAGAISPHPSNPNLIYVSTGAFGAHHIYKVDVTDLNSPVITPVVSVDIDAIGGIAVLDDTHIVVTNNANRTTLPFYSGNPTGLPVETNLLLQDLTLDGDFDDAGEIVELIAPIGISNPDPTFGLYTGAQARVIPAGAPGGLPSGAVALQTADNATSSELLIITNPANPGTAAYHPAGAAWFEGYGFNGGLDFHGGVAFLGGAYDGIFALSDLNASNSIDAANEMNLIVGPGDLGFFGFYDFVIDGEGDIFATANDFVAGEIWTLPVPASPLTAASQPMNIFATTNSPFVTVMALNSKAANFDPPATGNDAVLFFTANGAGFTNNPYVFWIAPLPVPPLAVGDWMQY